MENPNRKGKYILKIKDDLNKPAHRLKDKKKIVKATITTINYKRISMKI